MSNEAMMPQPFTIKVHEKVYEIKPLCETDCTLYEVSTKCEKLFTLKLAADGVWTTEEEDVIPISDNLVTDIGNAIELAI